MRNRLGARGPLLIDADIDDDGALFDHNPAVMNWGLPMAAMTISLMRQSSFSWVE